VDVDSVVDIEVIVTAIVTWTLCNADQDTTVEADAVADGLLRSISSQNWLACSLRVVADLVVASN
jgi:hypothetical protein